MIPEILFLHGQELKLCIGVNYIKKPPPPKTVDMF